ncbi:hypothetical protein AR543_p0002 (plasmid) [Paenibacillus bovis]|uniref:Uncharacterized protein n=1 Tax=Paenibacillus bovis TaxID=1616788 RepID=A0A1X9T3Q5_9BACL|nr:hypothetical protein AR543_p0002 [Paenibacillus bovis]
MGYYAEVKRGKNVLIKKEPARRFSHILALFSLGLDPDIKKRVLGFQHSTFIFYSFGLSACTLRGCVSEGQERTATWQLRCLVAVVIDLSSSQRRVAGLRRRSLPP